MVLWPGLRDREGEHGAAGGGGTHFDLLGEEEGEGTGEAADGVGHLELDFGGGLWWLGRAAQEGDGGGGGRLGGKEGAGGGVRGEPDGAVNAEHADLDLLLGWLQVWLGEGGIACGYAAVGDFGVPEAEGFFPVRAVEGVEGIFDAGGVVEVAGIDEGLDEVVADGEAVDLRVEFGGGVFDELVEQAHVA